MKYKYHLLLVVLSDAKIGSTLGRDLALSSLGRRHLVSSQCDSQLEVNHTCYGVCNQKRVYLMRDLVKTMWIQIRAKAYKCKCKVNIFSYVLKMQRKRNTILEDAAGMGAIIRHGSEILIFGCRKDIKALPSTSKISKHRIISAVTKLWDPSFSDNQLVRRVRSQKRYEFLINSVV